MSNTDSFIDEVNEELRRDRMFALLRRYGWIALLLVVLIVGGAAWNEYRKAQAVAQAQATGDAITAALAAGDPAAQAAALAAIDAPESARPVIALLQSAAALVQDDPAAARAQLQALAGDGALLPVYADLAALRLALMPDTAAETRAALLAQVATPGRPYRALALEVEAIETAARGETEAARALIEALLQEPDLPQGVRGRAMQLLLLTGGTPDN